MQIYELETKNGRVFSVAVANKSQQARLTKVIHDNKSKSYEVFVRIEVIKSGIHDIKQFEKLADSLV
ncbi:hypothetical protein [Sulfurimonas sp.]|uniref:hypothetical protein n=1 Tax=Sulfurimonas sp. TaxID=2022749 RepID=UPI0025E4C223|nr:hypothetical protein [Sulfurimonas sp.]MBW6487506.1 hypothetical protein [Sulfurimonas sp.]